MAASHFMPNLSDGPCFFCGQMSPNKPEDLLYCDLCRRQAHLTCLGSGKPCGTLLADNFFTLMCQACCGSEDNITSRAKMTTLQVLLLVLYNLHIKEPHSARSGFYHWKIHIYNFISHHWKEIYGPESRKKKKKMVQASLSGQLSHYSQFFTSGHEILKEGGWYQLRQPLSPATLLTRHKLGRRAEAQFSGRHIKIEPSTHHDEIDAARKNAEESEEKRGSWFTQREILNPETRPPSELFDSGDENEVPGDMEGGKPKVDIKDEVDIKEEELFEEPMEGMEQEGDMIVVDGGTSEFIQPSCQPASDPLDVGSNPSLFTKTPVIEPHHITLPEQSFSSGRGQQKSQEKNICRLSYYEERELLKRLEHGHLSFQIHRLRRKLAVRKQKMEHGLPLWNLDAEVKFLVEHGRVRTRRERHHSNTVHHHASSHTRVLDRFQVCSSDVAYKRQDENSSFLMRLGGQVEDNITLLYSPYTLRTLKPFIMRDYECEPVKLRLLREVEMYPHRSDPKWTPPPRHPLDYCYVTPQHVPAINQMARQFFWPGIDLSEVLQYPDHTCVVLYRKLVVGFGVVVPDTGFNEAYLSYLLVHPEWRRAGVATFVLYHLIQTCAGKDVTLHVSATNPALILYQRFGFKVEEFLSDFYDKYLPTDSPECKHAMYLRLSR